MRRAAPGLRDQPALRYRPAMRPFGELTRAGQARRLGRLATDVLTSAYALRPAAVRPVAAHSFNTVFRVETSGDRFALRVGDEHRIHVVGVEDVEAAWLDALAGEVPGLAASTIVRDASGRPWVTGRDPRVPATRTCTLFTWARGIPLRDRLSADRMRAAGRLLARLHEHVAVTAAIRVPDGLRATQVIYFEDTERLSNWQSTHGSLFLEAMARAQAALDDLWAAPPHLPHLLHGDFGPQNVMVWRDQLRVIDFQDLRLGFEVQDVGLSLADLARHEPELLEPFRAGYADVRRWPLDDAALAATLAACRSLNLVNLGLNLRRPGIERFLADHAARVRAWMQTPD
jgi:Ser/Thr protein kinase RdoA (MazF antagonist)